MNNNYKYKLLNEHVLGLLYFLKLENKTGYYSLKGIITELGDSAKTTPSEINEIAKYLEALGFIKAEFVFGDVFISITPAGIVHIEEVLDTNPTWKENILQLTCLKNTLNLVELNEESIIKAKLPILTLLNTMKESVRVKFGNFAKDAIDDLNILELELCKNNPDVEILAIKLDSIKRVSVLKSYIPQLRELLNL
jgi:DNA-binding MarR family transcriptional regulator